MNITFRSLIAILILTGGFCFFVEAQEVDTTAVEPMQINEIPEKPEELEIPEAVIIPEEPLAPSFYPPDLPRTITDTLLNAEFVLIPGGEFIMGSPEDEVGRYEYESPRHKVTMQPFYIMTTEVTQKQWTKVMETTVEQQRDSTDESWILAGVHGNNPMYYVSWEEAHIFLDSLNLQDPEAGYRLPTEAEWEYACRAGTATRFHAGDSTSHLDRTGWYRRNSGFETHKVGEKEANSWGLFDMHGNVWEWCEDDWHPDYEGAPDDGSAWIDQDTIEVDSVITITRTVTDSFMTEIDTSLADSLAGQYSVVTSEEEIDSTITVTAITRATRRVMRGSSWNNDLRRCRSANRGSQIPAHRSSGVGFRVVRTLPMP